MPRKPNYGAEKRAKELKRAAKQEEKRQERLRRRQEEASLESGLPQAASAQPEGQQS